MAAKPFDLALLFTGHMVDLPSRAQPRFPQYAEPIAWRVIRDAIVQARAVGRHKVVAIASGARGGDLLFHEASRLLGIERRMVLPFPPDRFVEESVSGVPNGGWEHKFWDNWNALDPSHREIVLPAPADGAFAKCNRRMAELAAELATSIRILALWDGKAGDGPGGTSDHLDEVRRMGGTAQVIDAAILLADK